MSKNPLKKLKLNNSGQSVLEVIVFITLLTFFLFFIPAIFKFVHVKNQLSDILTASIQKVATEGGLTDDAEDFIYDNIELKNLLPQGSTPAQRSTVILYSDADARGGHTTNLKYKDKADKKILISIYYPADNDVALLNDISRILGVKTSQLPYQTAPGVKYYYSEKLYVDSEKSSY